MNSSWSLFIYVIFFLIKKGLFIYVLFEFKHKDFFFILTNVFAKHRTLNSWCWIFNSWSIFHKIRL